jgi:hypothetical protein
MGDRGIGAYNSAMTNHPAALLVLLTLGLVGCPDTDTDTDTGASPLVEDCTLLCDRAVLCTESYVAPRIAADDEGDPDAFTCSFDDPAAARATCQAGCEAEGESPTAAACIECLAENMGCSTTGSLRPCDVDCEPTLFATGRDGEGALAYDYASWFFEGVSELEGLTCEETGA